VAFAALQPLGPRKNVAGCPPDDVSISTCLSAYQIDLPVCPSPVPEDNFIQNRQDNDDHKTDEDIKKPVVHGAPIRFKAPLRRLVRTARVCDVIFSITSGKAAGKADRETDCRPADGPEPCARRTANAATNEAPRSTGNEAGHATAECHVRGRLKRLYCISAGNKVNFEFAQFLDFNTNAP